MFSVNNRNYFIITVLPSINIHVFHMHKILFMDINTYIFRANYRRIYTIRYAINYLSETSFEYNDLEKKTILQKSTTRNMDLTTKIDIFSTY